MIEPTQGERDMADRFAKMEQKWRDANQRQKESIDRLMKQRQAALDLLHAATPLDMVYVLRDQIVGALNGDLP
jgi:uncharacterized membrane protein